MSTIAERLREFRAAVGLTQREVATLCGLGKRTIIYWEMGEREIKCSKLAPLVHEYDLDFNWLIMGSGSMFLQTAPPLDVQEAEPEYDQPEERLSMLDPEPPMEVPEVPEVPEAVDTSDIIWEDSPPATKQEHEDVLTLIQRLRRK